MSWKAKYEKQKVTTSIYKKEKGKDMDSLLHIARMRIQDQEWHQHQGFEGQRGNNKHEDMLDHQFRGDVGPYFLSLFA